MLGTRRIKRHFNKIVRTFPTLEDSQIVFINMLPDAVFASKAGEVAATLYSKIVLSLSGLYQMIRVRDNTLTISEVGIENSIGFSCGRLVPGLN